MGFVGRQSSGDVLVDLLLEMKTQFFVEFVVRTPSRGKRPDSQA